ncbi:MAG: EVE domain-containing protein [Herpetosiphonaceae bacterium]|nr:EVE domain-containing protein [Herpetosiphonaceae bacterium]
MQYWLLKTEPSTYSWDDLMRDGTTVWDGVRNNQALIHLRAMQPDDRVLIYHSGDERAVVGLAEITSGPYPDPQLADPKHVVVDVRAVQPVKHMVTLGTIKASAQFEQLALVRQPRLSVMPVTEAQWQRLLELCELT